MATRRTKASVRVPEGALIQRINRALAHQGERLRKTRGMRQFLDFGNYYTVDIQRNYVSGKHFDLEQLARDLGVLRSFESLAQPEA